MAAYYEEKVNLSSTQSIVVCVPHDKYPEFIDAIIKKNAEFMNAGSWRTISLESLRPNVKRLTKGSISYEDFRGAYF